ncbi:hypothetical protein Ddye_009010 [Dipteronia dyeriana]|uniref:Uncharacterized protein n=1 Tax=Dipteronia dyeriana TaxID=168575 RepID=A0AAD9XBH2_9ROSI|nr:hypothetical protein Ddye_009010 [Dipteronia dyeriana]
MLDFGEELTIDTLKIPWLILIQILVLLLLLILLYCFRLLSLDLSHNTTSSSSASPSSSSGPSLLIKRSTQPFQVGGSQRIKGEISTGTIRRRSVEVLTERERASTSASSTSSSSINYHPCHYFKLARLAFLKCLGLDSESQNSSNPREQRKE